jgi:sulfur carrier protein
LGDFRLLLTINGVGREVQASTVSELLVELEMAGPHIAVALNFQVIPKSKHPETALNADDKVEIVHAVGGGCGFE